MLGGKIKIFWDLCDKLCNLPMYWIHPGCDVYTIAGTSAISLPMHGVLGMGIPYHNCQIRNQMIKITLSIIQIKLCIMKIWL